MSTRSDAQSVSPVESVRPAARQADVNGEAVDRLGFRSATAMVQVGALGDGTWTPKLEHADDDGAGSPDTFSDVDADDLVGAFEDLSANEVQWVGYRGTKRHLRIVLEQDSATTDCLASGMILLGQPEIEPTGE